MYFLILNPHFIPFICSFIVGAVFLILAPVYYMGRTKKWFITPLDVFRYKGPESKMFLYGTIFILVGILGLAYVNSEYGYKRKVTGIHGNTKIEKVWPLGHNINADHVKN